MGQVISFKKAKEEGVAAAHPCAVMVKEFNTAMGSSKDPVLWRKLIMEEVEEAHDAAANLLKELMDLQYVIIGATQNGLACIETDAAAQIEVVEKLRGAFSQQALDVAFERVHESNMTKLWDDGLPHYREDGKVMKGPNYQEPYLIDLITEVH